MSRFRFDTTPLSGLIAATRLRLGDDRGFLSRLFSADEFREVGFDASVAQINHTLTRSKGTARGLHFQRPPHAEVKLVSCIRGRVFDVAVDIRRGSPTFLAWHGVELSADNHCSLLIPRGFAHGFQALCEDCELLYLHSAPYSAESEGGLDLRDPRLAIAWPHPPADLSTRDTAHPPLTSGFEGVDA